MRTFSSAHSSASSPLPPVATEKHPLTHGVVPSWPFFSGCFQNGFSLLCYTAYLSIQLGLSHQLFSVLMTLLTETDQQKHKPNQLNPHILSFQRINFSLLNRPNALFLSPKKLPVVTFDPFQCRFSRTTWLALVTNDFTRFGDAC